MRQQQASQIETLKETIKSLILEIQTLKVNQLDQIEEGRKIIAFKTETLNQSLKNLIEMQKHFSGVSDPQPAGTDQIPGLIQQFILKERAAAEKLERDHQQKLLQTLRDIQRISEYKQSIADFDLNEKKQELTPDSQEDQAGRENIADNQGKAFVKEIMSKLGPKQSD